MRQINRYFVGAWLLAALVAGLAPIGSAAAGTPTAVAAGPDLRATPALVREIQTMLSHLGFDPGPIDGIPRQLTNRAIGRFEVKNGLPAADLQPGGKVPADLLAALHRQTAPAASVQAPAATPPAAPAPQSPQSPAPAPAAPPAPPPDRFAACPYNPADFHIGTNAYTPDSFLKQGFDGSTAQAVAALKRRLQEARDIARDVGATAEKEVQRQSRVLHYFECRLKIEQAAAKKR